MPRPTPESASSTVDAPSVSGVELPAVIVAGVSSRLPNTGLSAASLSIEVSGRRFASRTRPRYGVMRSSKKPASYAAARRWWLASARASWSSRVMPHSAVVRAWCSPIDSPVRGSATSGATGVRWLGRIFATAASFCGSVLARLSSSSAARSCSVTTIGASDAESTPPATATSIRPSRILSESDMIVSMPVAQAICTS